MMAPKCIPAVWLFFLLLAGIPTLPAAAETNAPTLRMTASNGVSAVFWPLTAYFDILQSTKDLSPAAAWTNLATGDQLVANYPYSATAGFGAWTTNIIGKEITWNLPAAGPHRFFRLIPPHNIPLCGFAIFYNGLLEFSTCATMNVKGRVHANGPIYVGSGSTLTFNEPVTTTSTISSPANNGYGPWTTTNWNVVFKGYPGYVTNINSLGFPFLNLTNCHSLIDIPPDGEDPWTGPLRFYQLAQMVLLVTNDFGGGVNPTVRLILQDGGMPGADPAKVILTYTDASPALLTMNLPFLTLTNSFYDQRELKTNIVTQIDVGLFSTWVSGNRIVRDKLPIGPLILYVSDRRIGSPTQSGKLAVVRLSNAAQLPANNNLGLTVATQNPLYTWGDYNTTTYAGSSSGTNNLYEVPAALISDSLTILSANWNDTNSRTKYYSSRTAVSTTINAAIVTGNVPSTTTDFYGNSGGVHNLPRLLEVWSNQNLYLNTSIARLWSSNMATNQFRDPGNYSLGNNPYYDPPTRYFRFDQNFLNPAKMPPGIPISD